MNSHIQLDERGRTSSFVGPDAVALFRAATIASGLEMYGKHRIQPNRNWTPKNMLAAATGITKKTYKRGEYLKASEDVKLWVKKMKAAIPVLDSKGELL